MVPNKKVPQSIPRESTGRTHSGTRSSVRDHRQFELRAFAASQVDHAEIWGILSIDRSIVQIWPYLQFM